MKTTDALRTMATEARVKARYFEARAGRIKGSKIAPLQVPSDRAAAERKALAFLAAAQRIEQLAEEETNV